MPGTPRFIIGLLAICLLGAATGKVYAHTSSATSSIVVPPPEVLLSDGALLASKPSIPPPPFALTVANDDELLLCALRLGNRLLCDDLVTYATARGVLLPLGEFSRLLELGITVEPTTGLARGFVADTRRPFTLDMPSASVTIAGKAYRYDLTRIEAHADDIYVESALLAEWCAMRIEADRYNALVIVHPFQPLPLQERLAREQRGSNSWGYGLTSASGYSRVPHPHRPLAGPSLDLSLSTSYTSPGHPTTLAPLQYSTLLTGDLAWLNGHCYLSGDTASGLRSTRVTLGRADPDGELLGPLHARRVTFGDVEAVTLPLLGGSGDQPGIVISSYPLAQPQLFDMQSFHGTLPAGWDVELYRNNILLDYRPATLEERYDFRDIPLLFGENELQLIFYGPQGQRRIEEHTYTVGTNMLRPGTWAYRLSATRQEPGPLLTWQHDIGLTQALTLNSSLASAALNDGTHQFAGLGLNGYCHRCQVDAHIAQDLTGGGWAHDLGVVAKLGEMGLSARLMTNTGLATFSTTAAPPRATDRTLRLRLDGLRVIRDWHVAPLSLEFSRRTGDAAGSLATLALTQSHWWHRMQMTHRLTYERQEDGLQTTTTLTGTSYANQRWRTTTIRGELTHSLMPTRSLDTLALSLEHPLPHAYQLSGGVLYDMASQTTHVTGGLHRAAGACAVSLTANYTSSGTWTTGVSLATNASREPRTGTWFLDARPLAAQAGVSARAFLDANRNDQWDAGESLLENVGFFVNNRSHQTLTAPNGIAFLRDLSANLPIDLALSPSTLEDTLWLPAHPGLRCIPRPGHAVALDFPLLITGEVIGTVQIRRQENTTPAAGITVEAVDASGQTVARTRSAFDGFYSLTALPTGTYTVRVSPEQAHRLRVATTPRAVTIPPSGECVNDVDLLLLVAAETAPAITPGISRLAATPRFLIPPALPRPTVATPPATTKADPSLFPTFTYQPANRALETFEAAYASSASLLGFLRAPRCHAGHTKTAHAWPTMVHFALDSARISPASAGILARVVHLMRANATVQLALRGHTDTRASVAYNKQLSIRRVQAVHEYLLRAGIAPQRISLSALGETQPLVQATDETTHARNRRVELTYSWAPPPPYKRTP